MNIKTAKATLKKARELRKAGELLQAARVYLGAQIWAKQCRAKDADDVAFAGHIGASLTASDILKISTDHKERSEAGSIKSESYYHFTH